jgi:hypothetical protein
MVNEDPYNPKSSTWKWIVGIGILAIVYFALKYFGII